MSLRLGGISCEILEVPEVEAKKAEGMAKLQVPSPPAFAGSEAWDHA